MSDSVSLNSTGVGNSIMAQQTQREAALEGVELTGPWAQLWSKFSSKNVRFCQFEQHRCWKFNNGPTNPKRSSIGRR
uniref:Uncharacterized protein n=1 Tax=Meloidogyne incognita TaxID=6306 RepID=A0A914MYT4_MELIC